ncbi:hypothetical protein BD779DRAFT_1678155 [Infundibulicybe gibba]|nr:hypothetical protein BD779DRAFT_1678155 [Infundibulicybe gibba]
MGEVDATVPSTIGIIGAGSAGLITAQVLRRDGFNIQVVTRDSSAEGIWARSRVYPGLSLNNSVQGEFQFSSLPMEYTSSGTGNRVSGDEMCNYMETFAEKYLAGKIQFNIEVLDIRRNASAKWAPVQARSDDAAGPRGSVVVVGCGRSAQDIASCLANKGREVKLVFETADPFIATPVQLPDFIRKSRLLGVLSPHSELNTRLEVRLQSRPGVLCSNAGVNRRFLHKTWIGGKIVHFIWNQSARIALSTASVPSNSPLRRAYPLFWGIRGSEEGVCRPNGFHALVNRGKIGLVAPHRAAGFTPDGKSLVLENGETLAADVAVFATGYASSWSKVMSGKCWY